VELRHLRYFVAAAETENDSRAALKLHVSQPALSRQIRDLEDEIGFCLLERTAKSVRLTDAGRAFLSDARALLQQADEAVKKGRAIAGAESTELKVGYSPAATARILPAILRAYQRVMPKAHVKLHDWSNEENVAGLRDGRLNLAFCSSTAEGGFARRNSVRRTNPRTDLSGRAAAPRVRYSTERLTSRRSERTVHRSDARRVSRLSQFPFRDFWSS
jgi:DNA-binding transcriptional LysR family regulator